MNYPVSFWAQALRELTCFFFGHRWRSSWRRKPNFDELVKLPHDSLSYADHRSGNPYFEFVAWWHYKCTRCRLKTRDESWHPWYRNFWWGVKHGSGAVKIMVSSVFIDTKAPLWKKLLVVVPASLAFGFENFYIYFDRLPWFPLTIASNVHSWLYERLEGR